MKHIESYLVSTANFLWERKKSLIVSLLLAGFVLITAVYFDVEKGESEKLVIGMSFLLLFWCSSLLFFALNYKGEYLQKDQNYLGFKKAFTYTSNYLRYYGVIFFLLFFGGLSLLTMYALFGFCTAIAMRLQSVFA